MEIQIIIKIVTIIKSDRSSIHKVWHSYLSSVIFAGDVINTDINNKYSYHSFMIPFFVTIMLLDIIHFVI